MFNLYFINNLIRCCTLGALVNTCVYCDKSLFWNDSVTGRLDVMLETLCYVSPTDVSHRTSSK